MSDHLIAEANRHAKALTFAAGSAFSRKRLSALETALAAERARVRQLALDACRAAAIVPVVWYPTGYYVNPNDLGKINKQQVDACVAAIDAAIKEDCT